MARRSDSLASIPIGKYILDFGLSEMHDCNLKSRVNKGRKRRKKGTGSGRNELNLGSGGKCLNPSNPKAEAFRSL